MQKIFFLIICFASLIFASESLDKARSAYEKGDYEKASEIWTQALDSGLYNAEILYNLGNANYRLGKIGYAVFYYESALALSPTDKDIAYNLNLAKEKTRDKVETTQEENPILSSLFNLHHALELNTQLLILIVLFWAISIFAFLRIVLRSPKAKNLSIGFLFLFSLVSCVILSSALYKIHQQETHKIGVVLSKNTDVLSGPNEKNSTLHVLSEGTVFDLRSVQGKWAEISIGERIRGFVSIADVGIVK